MPGFNWEEECVVLLYEFRSMVSLKMLQESSNKCECSN